MASGLFALLDDIAVLMDDVVVMTKLATKKTAGILGDDLAVNAEKSSGFVSSREMPVLWAIAKGSLINKIIILPIAFLLSAFWPFGVIIVLVLGGVYLAYEGAEKIYEYIFHRKEHKTHIEEAAPPTPEEVVKKEKEKIKSAIVTDFILSVEIIIIALGTVIESSLTIQILTVCMVALIATVGVYGIVALIVRMDDLGYYMIQQAGEKKNLLSFSGHFLVRALPWLIKSLAFVGTIALFLVAGGIFVHNVAFFHHILETIPSVLRDFIVGFGIGVVSLAFINPMRFLWAKFA